MVHRKPTTQSGTAHDMKDARVPGLLGRVNRVLADSKDTGNAIACRYATVPLAYALYASSDNEYIVLNQFRKALTNFFAS